jgi:multiple sugar transport system ATP-binding protein
MSEMQRVALARVLITTPRLLLLDEPMSNLDASIRLSLRTELKQIQKSLHQSVLYVTHDQIEAMSMSDRIAVMNEGQIQQIGSPDTIYNYPVNKFVAQFIGDPPINILPCDTKVSGGSVAALTELGDLILLGKGGVAESGAFELGIRPHDIKVTKNNKPDSHRHVVRFVENLGAEHILHIEYGNQLLAAASRPGTATVGEQVGIEFDRLRTHLIEQRTGRIVYFSQHELRNGLARS